MAEYIQLLGSSTPEIVVHNAFNVILWRSRGGRTE